MDTKTRPLYMLSTRDPLQNKGHIQTKSEGLEKIFLFFFFIVLDFVIHLNETAMGLHVKSLKSLLKKMFSFVFTGLMK